MMQFASSDVCDWSAMYGAMDCLLVRASIAPTFAHIVCLGVADRNNDMLAGLWGVLRVSLPVSPVHRALP